MSADTPPQPSPFDRIRGNRYFKNDKVFLGHSLDPSVGLGVFASQGFAEGDLIERCPMIQLGFRSRYHSDPQLSRYLYNDKSCGCEQCKMHGHHMFMVLGYGMLYNHQNEPNARWAFDYAKLVADVIALRAIGPEEEVFVSYGDKYFSNRPYVDYWKRADAKD